MASDLKIAGYPNGVVPVVAQSGIVAATAAIATLAHATSQLQGLTTFLTGILVTSNGATSTGAVTLSITGLTSTDITIVYAHLGTVGTPDPLLIKFDPPLPATAPSTDIVVTLPSLGTGNTAASVVATGFQA